MFGLYDLEFLLEKSLSVKLLINKEVFGIADGFLVRWKFDFWVVKWLKYLILVGFDDMGYDNVLIWIKIEFYLILFGFWGYRQGKILKKVCGWISYRVCCISSQSSWFFPPLHHKMTVFLHFSVCYSWYTTDSLLSYNKRL